MEPSLNSNCYSYHVHVIEENFFLKKGMACLPILGVIPGLFFEISLIKQVYSNISDKRKVECLHLLNHYFMCDMIRDSLSLATLEYMDSQFKLNSMIKPTLYTVATVTNLWRVYGIYLNQIDIKVLQEDEKLRKTVVEHLK